ncbi:NAD(P)H-dependent oxidoreductase [Pseudorhodobacter wandonensis]|jgi:nitroreductase / dihydropteridine reductase|uniref:NAD(P)H-dependent oxidoreductase n=1 Tax=Pseudorhodobacter wandonensis TaxID=1120568 RepID=UPI00067B9C40|nr:NAD(P)H-dependent oxidoreductase [Pseudorhodobacter wandonensis]
MLNEKLNWRYATKKMDPSKKVSQDKLDRILEAARLAPTSSGLQPFEVIVVTNPDVRAKLQEAGFGQSQITDSTALLVFAAWDNYTEARIDSVLELTEAVRGMKSDTLTGYFDRLKGMYLPRDERVNFEHAARQAYIGLGLAVTAAAFEEVDATPMEGFEPEKFDEILGLRKRGLKSVAILPVGYRAEEGDWLKGAKKVRRPMDKFVTLVA